MVAPVSSVPAQSFAAAYAELQAAPAHLLAQLVGGELVLQPRPNARHAAAATALSEELGPPFKRGKGGPGGWLILFEPELHLGRDVLVPDLAGWRRQRLPQVGDESYFELAPDWVCEVLLPSTAGLDRVRKMPLYAAAGVEHVWLVDPLARTLEVFERRESQWLLVVVFEQSDLVRAVPFDAVPLELAVLWADAT